MNLKSVAAAKKVGTNSLGKLDNVGAKVLLALDDTFGDVETELTMAAIGVAGNILAGMVPAEFMAANAVAGKLEVTDFIEYGDVGSDIVIAGSALSAASKFKTSYEKHGVIDKMSYSEFEAYLNNGCKPKANNNTVVNAAVPEGFEEYFNAEEAETV